MVEERTRTHAVININGCSVSSSGKSALARLLGNFRVLYKKFPEVQR